MIIECKLGKFVLTDEIQIEEIIRKCSIDSLDDIWVSLSETQEYPSLAVLTNRDLACVHYFNGNEMYQSCGDLDNNGTVEFCPGGEVSEMPAYTAITLDEAIECVKAFMKCSDRPACIVWNEL